MTQPILAHGLGLTGRGEVAAATAPLLLGLAVLTLGLPESLTYYVARRAVGLRRATKVSLGLLVLAGLSGSAVIAVFALPLSAEDPTLAQLMTAAGCALVPALVVAGLRGLAAGRQMWTVIALERFSGALIQAAALVVLFALGELTVLTATVVIALTTFVGGGVYLYALFAMGAIRDDSTDVPKSGRPRVLHYAGAIWLGSVSGIALTRLDHVLITPLAGVAELGLYTVAVGVAEVILVFNRAVRDVMFTVEAGSPDPSRLGRAARVSTLITLVLGLAIAAACPWAIPVLFGPQFEGAFPVTLILIATIVLCNPASVAGAGLSARGRPGLRSFSLGVGAAVNVVAILLLVPPYGALGAAVATLIGNAVAASLIIICLRVAYGVSIAEFWRFRLSDVREIGVQISRLFSKRADI